MATELRHYYSDDHSPFTIDGKELSWQETMKLPVETLLEPEVGQGIIQGYNCIRRAGIDNVAELVSQAPHELRQNRNYGPKSHDIVAERLAKYGLGFPTHEPCGILEGCKDDCFFTRFWDSSWHHETRHLPLGNAKKLPLDAIRPLDMPCEGEVFGDMRVVELADLTPEQIRERITNADLYYQKWVAARKSEKTVAKNDMREAYIEWMVDLRLRLLEDVQK